jgi:16S rRNA (cytidine1402-2'-O)-methyltransferase
MLEIFQDRRIVLVRELTKKFEETIRGRISEVIEAIKNRELKGEIVLIVEGYERGV